MPFDPTKPAASSALSSAEMRNQLNGLKTEIDDKPATGDTARNPNGQMPNLDPSWEPNDPPTADDLRWVRDRLVEMYNSTAR